MPETKIRLPLLDAQADVAEFHRVMGLPVRARPISESETETDGYLAEATLRSELLREECEETRHALETGDLVGLADGLADLIYVALGTAVQFGISMPEVWNEVQRSNMTKVGPGGMVIRRADGKILKPQTFSPANIAGVLKRQMALPEAPTGA